MRNLSVNPLDFQYIIHHHWDINKHKRSILKHKTNQSTLSDDSPNNLLCNKLFAGRKSYR